MKQKLVLFDIDGTLVSATNKGVEYWKKRVRKVFSEVYKVHHEFPIDVKEFNGLVDKKLLKTIGVRLGISEEIFIKNFPRAKNVFYTQLKEAISRKEIKYFPITTAINLVEKLLKKEHLKLGIVTGNIEKNGWLKLKSAGINHFSFGAFGDEVVERKDLVVHAIEKANSHFKTKFLPQEVVVIGDTVHDIHAGKVNGVVAIAVATGMTDTKDDLRKAGADVVVDALNDKEVLEFFGM